MSRMADTTQLTLPGVERAQRDFDRKLAAILAAPRQLQTGAHRSRLCRYVFAADKPGF